MLLQFDPCVVYTFKNGFKWLIPCPGSSPNLFRFTYITLPSFYHTTICPNYKFNANFDPPTCLFSLR